MNEVIYGAGALRGAVLLFIVLPVLAVLTYCIIETIKEGKDE